MAREEVGANELDVMPTKALFVDMLTRDIPIDRAVIDLIDNSVDGALRLRKDASLEGLEVHLNLSKASFQISDNCGGMSIEHARNFAFRFGRPKDMKPTPGSVGQFGVGMKRALFRFGKAFEVQSSTQSESFVVDVNVDTWKDEDTPWTFVFSETKRNLNKRLEDTGTKIVVTNLHDNVSDAFGDQRYKINLTRQIEAAQEHYLERGLRIIVDGRPLISTPWTLLESTQLHSARVEETINGQGKEPVYIRIFAGISKSEPKNAGWYVICNGRMLLEADQSSATGWSDLAETVKVAIPKFHNQFARFRGYVFFDCSDTSRLPWNTTKTGIDEDNPIYRSVKQKMMDMTRPIIDFLNDLDAEKDFSEAKDKVLEPAVAATSSSKLADITLRAAFARPPSVRSPATVSIQYRRDKAAVDALQKALGVTSARAAGEKSFDYAFEKFVGED